MDFIGFLKKHFIVISLIMNILFMLLFYFFVISHRSSQETVTPSEMSIEESTDAAMVQKKVNEDGNSNITRTQAEQITHQIETIVITKEVPVEVVTTTGAEYKEKAVKYAEAQKADAVLITPSPDEEKKIEDIKKEDVVNLNQYNIKAYPDNLIGIGVGFDGSKELEYQRRVKIFKENVYVGPMIRLDNDNKVTAGVKLTFTF